MESLVAPCFNLALLVGFLVYKLRQPLKDFVFERHQSIAQEITTVHEQLEKAKQRYDEFSKKLQAMDAEIKELREQAKRDSIAMSQRVVSEANRIAVILQGDAKNAAASLVSEFKGQLYFDLSGRVLERTESLLRERLTGDDQVRIRQEFARKLETIQ